MRTTLAALAVVPLLTIGGTAHADDPLEDHRPCVTNRESHSGTVFGMSQAEVEARWEVTGKGIAIINELGWPVVAYPWCDHQFHNHSPEPYDYIGAMYNARGRLTMVLWHNGVPA
jgi:hypothetical protein